MDQNGATGDEAMTGFAISEAVSGPVFPRITEMSGFTDLRTI